MPLGSVTNRRPPFASTPATMRDTPYGRTPEYCVNWWHWSARCFATVSTSTGSSYVMRVPCEKYRALSTCTRASGVYPAAAIPMCLSTWNIFCVVLDVCSCSGFSSTATTTPPSDLAPTASVPRLTVSIAYSTW